MRVAAGQKRGLGSAGVSANTPLGIFAVSGYANQTRAYSLKPAIKGGNGTRAFSLSSGSLPAGLSLNATTGEITGTPTSAGTTSGLAITVTDPTGSAVSNTFSIVAGTAPTSITPSADSTGATDKAAINAALAGGASVVLSGSYFINGPIVQPGNTAIYCDSGSIFLAAASNTQMWVNTNQAAQTRTDQNMPVVGANNFYFNGNANNQVLQTIARSNQGFTAVSVSNLKISGIKVQSRAGAFFMIGSTYCSMHTIEMAQTTAAVNSDGLDIGGGCSFILAENFSGYVKDDMFSFFAKNKQSATMMAAGTPWEAGANVSDIYINTVSADLGLANMFRLQAGNGFTLTGIYGKGITNISALAGRFLIQTGEVTYLDNAVNVPLHTDLSNIVMDTVTGFDNWLRADTSCSDIHIWNITQNKALQTAIASNETGAPTLLNITFDGVTDTSAGGHATLIDATATSAYWNDIEFRNVALKDLTTFVNSINSLMAMVFTNITLVGGSAPAFTTTKKGAGTFTSVTRAAVAIDPSAAFQTIQSGVFQDSFNRADEDLSANANWVLISGVSTGAQVASNVLKANNVASAGTATAGPDLGSRNHYVQAVNNHTSGAGASFLCARLMDYNNWVGVRYNPTSTQWEMYQRVGSTLTSLGTAADAAGGGKTMRLEVSGLNATLKVNGASVITSAFSPKIVSSRAGVNCRSVVVANWLDNFECGAL